MAELVVAAVIYVEVEQTRRDKFYDEATAPSPSNERRQLYAAFGELAARRNLREVDDALITEFGALVRDHAALRDAAEKQLIIFSKLGHMNRPWLVIDWYPQVAFPITVMLSGFIRDRRANGRGKAFAKHFIKLGVALAKHFEQNPDTIEVDGVRFECNKCSHFFAGL